MANLYLGRGAAIGLGEEVTWGTAVSVTNWFQLLPGASLRRDIEKIERNAMEVSGTVNVPRGHFRSTDNVSGGFSINMNYQNCGMLLKHAIGGVATSGAGPDYTHDFTLAAEPPTGLSMDLVRGTGPSEKFEGCKVNRVTWSREAGGLLVMSIDDVIGETSAARGAPSTPSYGATAFDMGEFARPSDATTFTWNSVSYTVRGWSITLDNNLTRRPQDGSLVTLEPCRNGPVRVSCQVTLEVQDDIYAEFISDTESDALIKVEKAANKSIQFDLKNAYIDDVSDPIAAPGKILQTVTLMPQGDGTDHGLAVTLKNQQAAAISNG